MTDEANENLKVSVKTRPMCYLRPAQSKEFACDLCWTDDEGVYHRRSVSDKGLLNLIVDGTKLLRERAFPNDPDTA